MKTIIPQRRYRFWPKDFTLRGRTHCKTITLAPRVSCTEINRFFRITRAKYTVQTGWICYGQPDACPQTGRSSADQARRYWGLPHVGGVLRTRVNWKRIAQNFGWEVSLGELPKVTEPKKMVLCFMPTMKAGGQSVPWRCWLMIW